MRLLLMRVERCALGKALGAEYPGPLTPTGIIGQDDQIIRSGNEREAGRSHVVSSFSLRQEDLPDRDAVFIECEHAALRVHSHIDVPRNTGPRCRSTR